MSLQFTSPRLGPDFPCLSNWSGLNQPNMCFWESPKTVFSSQLEKRTFSVFLRYLFISFFVSLFRADSMGNLFLTIFNNCVFGPKWWIKFLMPCWRDLLFAGLVSPGFVSQVAADRMGCTHLCFWEFPQKVAVATKKEKTKIRCSFNNIKQKSKRTTM